MTTGVRNNVVDRARLVTLDDHPDRGILELDVPPQGLRMAASRPAGSLPFAAHLPALLWASVFAGFAASAASTTAAMSLGLIRGCLGRFLSVRPPSHSS